MTLQVTQKYVCGIRDRFDEPSVSSTHLSGGRISPEELRESCAEDSMRLLDCTCFMETRREPSKLSLRSWIICRVF